MTSKRGFCGEGGVVSQGSRALRPTKPDTLATGTTPWLSDSSARKNREVIQCLKTIEKVSFYIASEASYIYNRQTSLKMPVEF